MPPTTVTSAVGERGRLGSETVISRIEFSAVQGAVVSAELAGVVSEINFENGAEAKKGEVLMKLDASQEEALLRSAEADAQLASTDLERARDLAMKKVVSSAELDSAQSKFRRMNAVVDQMRSSIAKKTASRAVRWAAWYSPGERWANDQRRSAGRAADSARSGLCRFCVAPARSLEAGDRVWKFTCAPMRCLDTNSKEN